MTPLAFPRALAACLLPALVLLGAGWAPADIFDAVKAGDAAKVRALIEADPGRFFRPPYVGINGWVGVVLDGKPDWAQVSWLVDRAFRHVAQPRLLALLPPAPPGPIAPARAKRPAPQRPRRSK